MIEPQGYLQLTVGASAMGLGDGVAGMTSAAPLAAGTGYEVGDLLTVAIGSGVLTPGARKSTAVYQVTSVSGSGGVTGVQPVTKGSYTTTPGATVTTTTNSVAGTGATLTPTYTTPFVPDAAVSCFLQAEAQNVRWRDDGVDPTATVGNLLIAGASPIVYDGDLRVLRCIQVADGAVLNVSFYGEGGV